MGNPNEDAKKHYSKVVEEIVYKPTTVNNTNNRWSALEPLNTGNEQNKPKDALFLWITVFVANLSAFCAGISFSWTSPVFPKLDAPDSPLGVPTTAAQKSWIATSMCLGAMIGPLVAGKLADCLGRKKTIILVTFPALIAFFVLAFATNVYLFYLARFSHGLTVGSILPLIALYVGEIAEPHNRGKLVCIGGSCVTAGVFYPYLVGPYLSIKLFSLSCAIPLVIFFLIFPIFMPESPYFLITVNRNDEAEHALKKLRHKHSPFQKELMEITELIQNDRKNKGGLKDFFHVPAQRKSLIISGGLVILTQFSGINAVTGYLHTIFEETGSTISPNISSVIVGSLKVLTTMVAAFLVEKLGRKTLLLGSCVGCVVSLSALGAYFYLKKHDFDVKVIWWLPVTCMMVYIVAFNIGLGPVPWTIVSEVFPSNVKSVASSITSFINFFAQGGITMCFPIIAAALGLAQCFWIFGILCLLGIVFIGIVVPETKGKSFGEIQKLLN